MSVSWFHFVRLLSLKNMVFFLSLKELPVQRFSLPEKKVVTKLVSYSPVLVSLLFTNSSLMELNFSLVKLVMIFRHMPALP